MENFGRLIFLCFILAAECSPPTARTIKDPEEIIDEIRQIRHKKDFYYWKDYYETIPEDAFEAGSDAEGNPTYIGQTLFADQKWLYPTIITRGNTIPYIFIGTTKYQNVKRTKILCSSNNDLFKWIPTDIEKVRYLTGCRQIEAGWQGEVLLTVGRANHQGRTITGRVYDTATNPALNGLWIHDATSKEQRLTKFEVLVYNCTNPWVEELK